MRLLDMSVAGGVVILAVIVIRALGVHRLPKAMFTALWAVALIRLLVPVSVPSAVSVYGWAGPRSVSSAPADSAWETVPAAAGGEVRPAAGWSAEPDRGEETGRRLEKQTSPVPRGAVDIPWETIIWAAGVLGCGSFFAASYGACRRRFWEAVTVEDSFIRRWQEGHSLRRRVSVRLSGRVDTPMTYGIIRPVILLPAGIDWRDEKGLGFILAHEYGHIRRLDGLRKLVLTAAVCLHWFNPLVWAMFVLANRDMEMACDEQVVRSMAGDGRADYARTLIHMEEAKAGLVPLVSHFSANAMEERITAIMKSKKLTAWAVILSLILTIGVTAVFATSAPEEGPAEEPVPYDWGDAAVLFPVRSGQWEKHFVDVSIQWWEPDDFARWVEEQRPLLTAAVGSTPNTGTVAVDGAWTEERSERVLAAYEDIAAALEAGTGKLSKTIGGGGQMVLAVDMDWPLDMGSEKTIRGYDVETLLWGAPEDWPEDAPAQTYSVEMVPGEKWVDFGPSQTSAGLFRTVRAYFQCMVQAGAMDREWANGILEDWWAQNQGSSFPDSYLIHTRQETDPDAPYGPLEEDWLGWLGEDPLSFKVFYNGVSYQLPAPVEDFAANGWTVTEGAGRTVAPGESCPIALTLSEAGGQILETRVRNYSGGPLPVENCYVTFVEGGTDAAEVSIVVPAPGIGIAWGMPGRELTRALRGMDYTLDEDGDGVCYTIANDDGSVVIRTTREDIQVTCIQVTCEPESLAFPAAPAVTPEPWTDPFPEEPALAGGAAEEFPDEPAATPELLPVEDLKARYVWDLTSGSGAVYEENPEDADYLLDIRPYGYRTPVDFQYISGGQSFNSPLQPGAGAIVGSSLGTYEILVIVHSEGQLTMVQRSLNGSEENPVGGQTLDVKDGDIITGSCGWTAEGGTEFYIRNTGETELKIDAFLYETK